MDKKKLQETAYMVGYSLGLIVLGCIGLVIMALAVKFLIWLF